MLERVFIRAVSMLTADSVSPLLSLELEQSLARSGKTCTSTAMAGQREAAVTSTNNRACTDSITAVMNHVLYVWIYFLK